MGTAVGPPGRAPLAPSRPEAPGRRRRERWNWPLNLSILGIWLLSFNNAVVAGSKVSDWCFVAAGGAVAVNVLTGRTRRLAPMERRRTPPLVLVGTLLLMTGGAASSLFSVDAISSLLEVVRYGSVTLLWFWLLRTVTASRESMWKLVQAFKFTCLISCFGAFLGVTGLVLMNGDPTGPTANRQTAWFDHPNLLGFLLAIGLPLFFFDLPPARKERSELGRLAHRWVPTAVVGFCLASTGSMTGALAALAGLVTIGIARQLTAGGQRRDVRPSPVSLFAALLVVPVAVALLFQSDSPVVERLTRFREGEAYVNYSVNARGEYNAYALGQIGDRLLVGIGLDEKSKEVFPPPPSAAADHNMYLTVLVDAGLPALVGLALVLGWAWKTAWLLVRRTTDPHLYTLALALLGSTTGAVLEAYFHPVQHFRVYWYPIAMITVLWSVRRYEARHGVRLDGDNTGHRPDRPVHRPGFPVALGPPVALALPAGPGAAGAAGGNGHGPDGYGDGDGYGDDRFGLGPPPTGPAPG